MTSANRQWPPRRAGCSGDCWQGRAPCDCALIQREGLSAIDTLIHRADCDPALPIGQDEDSEPIARDLGREVLDWIHTRFGWLVLVVMVASVAAALLTVHFRASAAEPVHVPVVSTRGMT